MIPPFPPLISSNGDSPRPLGRLAWAMGFIALFLSASARGGAPIAGATPPPPTLPFLHSHGTAIVDEKDHPVILRGCNLGSWLLMEMWMMGLNRPGDPTDQWRLAQLLTQRFGATDAEG